MSQRKSRLQTPTARATLASAKHISFAGYTPPRFVPTGIYTGESWDNVRTGSLNPARPRIRSAG